MKQLMLSEAEEPQANMLEVKLLVEAIHQRYHYDFRGYSPASLARQLNRAQERFGCRSLSMLQHRVLHEPTVMPELVNLLTIQVSDLFRDPSYFRTLREHVVPHLVTYPSIKVWIAGCGDGEELYSLAILFREEGLSSRTIFYATDINQSALRKAEAGVYDIERLPLFTENHQRSGGKTSLSSYYTAAYGAAVFDRSLCENVVFADHSLASDQVFAEVHLVSCRNVLIYFDRELQDRAIGIFNDALVRGGFLGLGAQESVRFSRHFSQFREFSMKDRIYRKTNASQDGGEKRDLA
jgi:chemotaxis protein methyltransferase CheR